MIRATLLAVAASLAAAGCVNLAPRYERPPAPVAPAWSISAGATADTPAGDVADLRWDQFHSDARLRDLIARALANNRDLRATALAVESARAQLRLSRANELPTLAAGTSYAAQRSQGQTARQTSIELGISAFELDLFGRLRNLRESAIENLLAADETVRSTRISLVAEVATAYVALLADEQRLRLAEETFASQQKSLDLTQRTFDIGTASGLDVAQARTTVETARADRATYRTQVTQDVNALELLVGETLAADALGVEGAAAGDRLLAVARDIGAPARLSSDLLLRRPDVLAAENKLRAANVDIGAARAARFPTISLTTSIGQASAELSDLFSGAARTWSFVPALSVALFDGGAGAANVRGAEVSREAAVASYEQTIQIAFREVADALAQRRGIDELLAARRTLVTANERTYAAHRGALSARPGQLAGAARCPTLARQRAAEPDHRTLRRSVEPDHAVPRVWRRLAIAGSRRLQMGDDARTRSFRPLTKLEFRMLRLLLSQPGRGCSRTQLLDTLHADGNTKSSDFSPARLIHFCTASRVAGVISNCTGRWVLCCITTARVATWSPWQMSRT